MGAFRTLDVVFGVSGLHSLRCQPQTPLYIFQGYRFIFYPTFSSSVSSLDFHFHCNFIWLPHETQRKVAGTLCSYAAPALPRPPFHATPVCPSVRVRCKDAY